MDASKNVNELSVLFCLGLNTANIITGSIQTETLSSMTFKVKKLFSTSLGHIKFLNHGFGSK